MFLNDTLASIKMYALNLQPIGTSSINKRLTKTRHYKDFNFTKTHLRFFIKLIINEVSIEKGYSPIFYFQLYFFALTLHKFA